MRKILTALAACLAALLFVELVLRAELFDHVSYSNSDSIDRQLRDRDRHHDWDVLFVGDSEVMWGVDPDDIDRAAAEVGLHIRSFNHAFEGFGPSWWTALLPPLLAHPSLANVNTVAVGVQMIESHRVVTPTNAECGDLQRPVLTSPLGIDLGVDRLCRQDNWDVALGRRLFHPLWTVRYASAVRQLLMSPVVDTAPSHLKSNSAKNGEPIRGFEPHRPIADHPQAVAEETQRWLAQYHAEDLKPLAPESWPAMVAEGGFFDQLNDIVGAQHRRLVLFALPTNPQVIDAFHRRADYARNSTLLKQWAETHGVVFFDLGIRDVADPASYFSDVRHLSEQGAHAYSTELGKALGASSPPIPLDKM